MDSSEGKDVVGAETVQYISCCVPTSPQGAACTSPVDSVWEGFGVCSGAAEAWVFAVGVKAGI
jgi:hypothetical protein